MATNLFSTGNDNDDDNSEALHHLQAAMRRRDYTTMRLAFFPDLASPPLSRHGKVDRRKLREMIKWQHQVESMKRKTSAGNSNGKDDFINAFLHEISRSLSITTEELLAKMEAGQLQSPWSRISYSCIPLDLKLAVSCKFSI